MKRQAEIEEEDLLDEEEMNQNEDHGKDQVEHYGSGQIKDLIQEVDENLEQDPTEDQIDMNSGFNQQR